MQIRITSFSATKVLAALAANGFGTIVTENLLRGYSGSDSAVEMVAIWTEDGYKGPDDYKGPGGYEVGLIRRELSSFAASHELVLETNRIPQDRLMALLGRIATENG